MPPPPPIPLAALLLLLLLLAAARLLHQRLLASPLARIPGPRLSLLTSATLRWHELRAGRTRYVHALHARYGPAVRLGPGEVAFAGADAVREIYGSGGSGYDKTGFYDLFTVYGRRTMFSTLGRDEHARRKRILADRYANSNVMKEQSLSGIEERAGKFLRKCYASVGGSLDLYISLHAYAFDCASHHLFHPYGANSLENPEDEAIMREVTFDSSLQNRLLRYYSPTLHRLVGGALSLAGARPRETPLADRFVLDAAARTDAAPFTLLSRLRDRSRSRSKSEEEGGGQNGGGGDLDALAVAAECLDHMAAGIDTTGDALCFLMWELSQPCSAGFQERLRRELRSAGAGAKTETGGGGGGGDNGAGVGPGPGAGAGALPFLDAVVTEGLRCFPAIPMSLPRRVPAGGRRIAGYEVPAGTVVSCQAASVHRADPWVFPEPDRFDPCRWLAVEGGAERRRAFFAFSSGGRGCVGKHLALAEMKILLRAVYTRFRTVADPSMRAEEMEMSDQLISSRPRGQRCLLQFIPVDADS